MIFGDGGAALHPVTAVVIRDPGDILECGTVDVTADNAVIAPLGCGMGSSLFKAFDIFERPSCAALDESGERPVRQATTTSQQPLPAIERQQQVVGARAEALQTVVVPDRVVELISVQQQQAPPVGCDMLCLGLDHDPLKTCLEVVTQRLVVIARNLGDPGAASSHVEYRAQGTVTRRWPVPTVARLP